MTTRRNFRQLVTAASRRGCADTEYGVPLKKLAAACGISRTYLYDLMKGSKEASDVVVAKLSAGLGYDARTVRAALNRTAAEASVI